MNESELNALSDKIDDGFRAVEKRFRALDTRLDQEFSEIRRMLSLLLRPEEVASARPRAKAPDVDVSPPPPSR